MNLFYEFLCWVQKNFLTELCIRLVKIFFRRLEFQQAIFILRKARYVINNHNYLFKRGGTLVTVIVFGAVFIGLITILVSQVVYEHRQIYRTVDKTYALQMAEAGLEKLRWYLAHNPGDYNGPNDVLLNGNGEYVWSQDYHDPISGELVGEIEYKILPETYCNITNNAQILITAKSHDSGQTYALKQIYTRESAANYSYIYNQNVRVGDDRMIRGRFHSNGEVRMDGRNDSVVSSSLKDGVYGRPPHPQARTDLWQDEVATIDFNGLAVDMIAIKDKADTTVSGSPSATSPLGQDNVDDLYFTRKESCVQVQQCKGKKNCWMQTECTNNIEAFEVELIDDNDSDGASIKVWELNNLVEIQRAHHTNDKEKYCGPGSAVNVADYDDADHDFDNIPVCNDGRTNYLGEFKLNPSCPVAFFEAPVFLYGTLDAKAVIAAGDLDTADEPNVYLFNHIFYESDDGSDGLSVVAEGDVKIAYSVPDDLHLRGIFIAQSGRYGRDHYTGHTFKRRDFLQVIGSIISDEGGGVNWSTPTEQNASGYLYRENYYDQDLSRRPPPLTPSVGSNYTYQEWRDEEVSR